jgi:hypothetical protein
MSLIPINDANTPFNGKMRTFIINGKRYVNNDDICQVLKFKNARDASRNHLNSDDILTLEEILRAAAVGYGDGGYTPNELRALYITEPSVFILAGKSPDKNLRKDFIRWYCANYTQIHQQQQPPLELPPVNNNILEFKNENQLHWRCIQYFRKMYPDHIKHIHAGLGELQSGDDDWVRIDAWRKGYVKGKVDFVLPLQNKHYNGIAVEFKNSNGTGVVSKEQLAYLEEMEDYNYKTAVVSDYDVWVKLIDDYMSSVRLPCKLCSRGFISKESLYNHNLYKHHFNTKTKEKQLPEPYGKPYEEEKKYFIYDGVLYVIKKEFNNSYYCKKLFIFKKIETIINTDENDINDTVPASAVVEIKFNLEREIKGGRYVDKKHIPELMNYEEASGSFSFRKVVSYNYVAI